MPTAEEQKKKDRRYVLLAFRIIGSFGAAIAAPVVLLVLLGQWLDERYALGNKATIGAFAISTLVSGLIVWRKAKAFGTEYLSIDKS